MWELQCGKGVTERPSVDVPRLLKGDGFIWGDGVTDSQVEMFEGR